MEQYDLIVLGAGPAGYLAAERAGQAGLKVLLIEKSKIGGVCLNEGCIPSKTLLHSAKIYHYANNGKPYGVTTNGEVRLDQSVVVSRKDKVVKTLVNGVRHSLKSANVKILEGHGVIQGRSLNDLQVAVGADVFSCDKLLIATGSETVIPSIPGVAEGLEAGTIVTNREILSLDQIPESLVVIGGGVIGLEMANYYNCVGSQVTVIEMLDHIAGTSDREIAGMLKKELEKSGIAFHLGCRVTDINQNWVSFTDGSEDKKIVAEKTLLSVGRRPVTKGFGLETLGITLSQGCLVTDRYGMTSDPKVYAAGDVNGTWMLAHVAYREAEVAVNHMLGKKDSMNYRAVPSVVYTSPEMAGVGETEESCQAKGLLYKKITLPMNYSGRYMAENEGGKGVCKLLVDPQDQRLLGCHILGSYASEIIMNVGIMIDTELSLDRIKTLIFPHPTVTEIIRESIFHI
ncbi:MAG: dihydrolipoyl dehydrogenase [Eubacteriales bacterium]|nr:dihydrolipoyl dehydrogenase [Eubacteriales bacterium]